MLEQWQCCQLRWRNPLVGPPTSAPLGPFEQPWAAHGHDVFVHKPIGLRTRPMRNLFGSAGVQRRIKTGLPKQERARAGLDVHHDVGVQDSESGQSGNKPAGGKGGHGRQRDCTALAAVGHDVQRIALQRLQAQGDLACILAACRGQGHPVAGAPEQGCAQKRFQCGDLAGDRTLRKEQLLGGSGVALMPRSSIKTGQCLGGRQDTAHVQEL